MLLKTKLCVTAIVATCVSTETLAQVQHRYVQPDPSVDFLLAASSACILLAALIWGLNKLMTSTWTNGRSDADDDWYRREADLMRDITKHQDAQTSMMRSEIDHTRTHGEYRERPDIAQHEQKLRQLRNKLR